MADFVSVLLHLPNQKIIMCKTSSFHNKNSNSLNLISKSLVAPRLPLKSCEAESSQPIVDPHVHNTLSKGLCHLYINANPSNLVHKEVRVGGNRPSAAPNPAASMDPHLKKSAVMIITNPDMINGNWSWDLLSLVWNELWIWSRPSKNWLDLTDKVVILKLNWLGWT